MDQQVDLDGDPFFSGDAPLDSTTLALSGTDHAVLQTQTVALSPPLLGRLNDLRVSGCLKSIAWGRQGHITAITDDGAHVTVQCLRILPGTNEWGLSSVKRLDQEFEQAITLSWSPTGVDLAVVDVKGQVSFFTMTTTCLNHLNEVKQNLLIPPEEQARPILTFWLNQDRPGRGPKTTISSLTKQNDQWVQNIGSVTPHRPQYGRAFLMINKKGIISLTYQDGDSPYRRTSINIPASQYAMFTHAAVSATTEGTLVVALHSADRHLSVYRIHIEWPSESIPNPSNPVHPVLSVDTVDINVSLLESGSSSVDTSLDQTYNPNAYVLTHLEILPTSELDHSIKQPPQIWAVLTAMDQSLGTTDVGLLQPSVIRRWNITQSERKFHPKFDEMATKPNSQTPNAAVSITERLPDTQFFQIILGIEFVDSGQQVAITTSDGQVEMWNPFTMRPTSEDTQASEVTSMAQSGLAFAPSPEASFIVMSPNAASSVMLQTDDTLYINHALYLGQPSQGLDVTNLQQSAATSSLILALSRACFSNSGSDDVLSSIASIYPPDQLDQLVSRMYAVMFRPEELIHEKAPGSMLDRTIQRPLVQKGLSFHLALYSSATQQPLQAGGFPHPNTWSRLWVWTTINLRYITASFFHLFREVQSNPSTTQPVSLAPSYTDMICNMIKYTFDLYRFIFETILQVGDRQTNPDMFDPPLDSPYFNLGDEQGDGSQGFVALLLNCNWSRFALLAAARSMRGIIAKQAEHPNPIFRQIVDAIHRHSVAKGCSIYAIETLFNGRWYQKIGIPDGEMFDPNIVVSGQVEMMATGRVGPHYENTIKHILASVINGEQGLRSSGHPNKISRLKLFTDTPDLSWITLNMERFIPSPGGNSGGVAPPSLLSSRYLFYDVHKKAPIVLRDADTVVDSAATMHEDRSNSPQLIRRCARCGSLSEDIQGTRWDWPKTLVTFNARCVCDGFWIIEPLTDKEPTTNSVGNSLGSIQNTNFHMA